MSFSFVQSKFGDSTQEAQQSFSVTMSAAPTQGNIVCVGFLAAEVLSGIFLNVPRTNPTPTSPVTGLTVLDGNGNAYTKTPNSPTTNVLSRITDATTALYSYLFYLNPAPSNAHAKITASWNERTFAAAMFLVEFNPSVPAFFVGDAGTLPTYIANGTTVDKPWMRSGAGDLLFAFVNPNDSISAPVDTGTLNGWTGAGIGAITGSAAEYILNSVAGEKSVAFTDTTSGGFVSAMAMCFSQAVDAISVPLQLQLS